jgi:hypothetical protein
VDESFNTLNKKMSYQRKLTHIVWLLAMAFAMLSAAVLSCSSFSSKNRANNGHRRYVRTAQEMITHHPIIK